MNKRLSKSVLITLTVFLVSFYMGATASADGLSMLDILNNDSSYVNENNNCLATLPSEKGYFFQSCKEPYQSSAQYHPALRLP